MSLPSRKRKPIEISVEVKLFGTDEWRNNVDAKAGDVLRFRIHFKNSSKSTMENVVVRDFLPNSLSYIEGSTMIANNAHPSGVKLSDGLTSLYGINLGDYAPKAGGWIYFNAKVEDAPCGILSNRVRVTADFPNSSNDNAAYVTT